MMMTLMTSWTCWVDDRDEDNEEMMDASMTTKQGRASRTRRTTRQTKRVKPNTREGLESRMMTMLGVMKQRGMGNALMMERLEKIGAWMKMLTMVAVLTMAIVNFDAIVTVVVM